MSRARPARVSARARMFGADVLLVVAVVSFALGVALAAVAR